MKKLTICILFICVSTVSARLPVKITTSPEDTEYLRGIMKDAFKSIYYFRNPTTGLASNFPDNPNSNELAKTENLFLTFASVAIAGKIGLIPEEDAIRETDKTLTFIEKFQRHFGFFRNYYRPGDGSSDSGPDAGGSLYNTSDYGWNPAALAVVGEAYPQFRQRTEKLLKETQWWRLYKPEQGTIEWLMHFHDDGTMSSENLLWDITQDVRSCVFMAIASGRVPPSVWTRMKAQELTRYGVTYFAPGERGGYSEQPWGLSYFLDERGSKFGLANANLVWAQILYAQDLEFPTWGWSGCASMSGFMAWGEHDTDWSRVNAHAVAAAAAVYPNQAVKAFRMMEKLGIRKPVITADGVKRDFGFRDSIDMDTGESPESIMPGIDQTILFLTLANYLYDGVVWKYFESNSMVKDAMSEIDDYSSPHEEYLDIYEKRDLEGPPPLSKNHPGELLFDNFSGEKNALGGARADVKSRTELWNGLAKFIFDSMDAETSYFKDDINGADLTDYNAVKFSIRGKENGTFMVNMNLGGESGYRQVNVTPEWREVVITFRSFLNEGNKGHTAMWYNRSSGGYISLGSVTAKEVELKKISFLSLPKEEIAKAARILKTTPTVTLGPRGLLDSMDNISGWGAFPGDGTQITASVEPGEKGSCGVYTFTISPSGGWIILSKKVILNLSEKSVVSFYMKGQGGPANLEVKVIDPSGATFMKVLKNEIKDSEWHLIKVPRSELRYGWGGIKKDAPQNIASLDLAITSGFSTAPVSGKVYLDEFSISQ